MSLDVSLYETLPCPHCAGPVASRHRVHEANITHNIAPMAKEAGIYEATWHPDEYGIETAAQVAAVLRPGLERLLAEPARFRALNPSNGWGSYDGLVGFVEKYLAACEDSPTALVEVSR